MKTLDEEITAQKDLVDALFHQLEGIHDSYMDIANDLDRVAVKHETELKHYRNLIVQRDMSKLREDAIQQLKETN